MTNLDLEKRVDLQGNINLIAGTSQSSRDKRDKLANELLRDHDLAGRVRKINTKWSPYNGGRQNFEIISGEYTELSKEECDYLIKQGDNYVIIDTENPLNADPLKYLLDHLISKIGKEYYKLKSTKETPEYQEMFESVVGGLLRDKLKEVVDRSTINYKLNSMSREIRNYFEKENETILNVFEEANSVGKINPKDERLKYLKGLMKGYLHDLVNTRDQVNFIDERDAILHWIGTQILEKKDPGRLSLVQLWSDGRSDHNETTKTELIRLQKEVDDLSNYNVKRIFMINAHSQKQIQMFRNAGIDVINLNMTNEFLSRVIYNPIIKLDEVYPLSVDKGSLEGTMVSARELYLRTKGDYNGRIVGLEKLRIKAGAIKDMSFKGSWIYVPENERPENFKLSSRGHRLPYDHEDLFGRTYKIKPTEKNPNPDYIGHLFKEEHNQQELELLKEKIKKHVALLFDDINDTSTTGCKGMNLVYDLFNSRSITGMDHASLTRDAIPKLTQLYEKKRLIKMFHSGTIHHPFFNLQWLEEIDPTKQIFHHIKDIGIMPWLETNFNQDYKRIERYSTTMGNEDYSFIPCMKNIQIQ